MYKTYSFQNIDCVLSHPAVGQLVLSGSGSDEKGVGDIAFSLANDNTVHDQAADGHTMISKIIVQSGTIAVAVQQVSDAQDFLARWCNYVTSKATPSKEFAEMTVTCTDAMTGESWDCKGVSPQKTADTTYQAQGQRVTWNLMAAEMIFEPGRSN